jgi:hypothetical protein
MGGALIVYLLSKKIKRSLSVEPLPRQALAWLMSAQRVLRRDRTGKCGWCFRLRFQDAPGAVVPLREHTALKRRDEDTTQLPYETKQGRSAGSVPFGGNTKCQIVLRAFRRAVHLPPCVLPENHG